MYGDGDDRSMSRGLSWLSIHLNVIYRRDDFKNAIQKLHKNTQESYISEVKRSFKSYTSFLDRRIKTWENLLDQISLQYNNKNTLHITHNGYKRNKGHR